MRPKFSPVRQIARISHPVSSRDKYLAMLIAYFDESGKERDHRAVALGTVIAPEEKWIEFEKKWNEILQRHDVKVFHMTDFETRNGEFKDKCWGNEERLSFIADLAEIVKNTITVGFAYSILVADYKEIILPTLKTRPEILRGLSVPLQAPSIHHRVGCADLFIPHLDRVNPLLDTP